MNLSPLFIGSQILINENSTNFSSLLNETFSKFSINKKSPYMIDELF